MSGVKGRSGRRTKLDENNVHKINTELHKLGSGWLLRNWNNLPDEQKIRVAQFLIGKFGLAPVNKTQHDYNINVMTHTPRPKVVDNSANVIDITPINTSSSDEADGVGDGSHTE